MTSQFTLTPFNLTTVVEGATVTLQCAYTNATAITWLRENVSISSSDYIVNNIGSSQSNLTILSADRNNHNASYSCQATRMDGSTVDFHFNVLVYCKYPSLIEHCLLLCHDSRDRNVQWVEPSWLYTSCHTSHEQLAASLHSAVLWMLCWKSSSVNNNHNSAPILYVPRHY